MTSRWKDAVARNLKIPQKGIIGWLLTKLAFKKRNSYLEKNAARLCNIQPDHRVLEIGCGVGYGIVDACGYIKDGNGKVNAIDYSTYMVEKASKRCRRLITKQKVQIVFGTVVQMPYNTDTFDRVFHTNCYYFWPNMKIALSEIYRVMKPGSEMITTLNLDDLKIAEAKGYMKYGHTDPLKYMIALENNGFENVHMEYMKDKNKDYQVIFANVCEKPAYDDESEDLLESENLTVQKTDERKQTYSIDNTGTKLNLPLT